MLEDEKQKKAYKAYMTKLTLLGVENAHEILEKKVRGISINLSRFAELCGYPRTLHIPNFVNEINRQNGKWLHTFDYKNPLRKIKQIYIPDGLELDSRDYEEIEKFEALKKIKITTRQFVLMPGIKMECRIPEEANMIITDKILKLLDYLMEKGYQSIPGQDLLIAFEVAARAAKEEDTLVALGLFALENKICLAEDLMEYLDKSVVNDMQALCDKQKDSEKALIIKCSKILKQVFEVRKNIDKKYKIKARKNLYKQISYPGNGLFDIGQKFKPNLVIKDNVLDGFDGNGWLGYIEYTMYGNVTPDLALEIIRLTSDYRPGLEIDGIELGRSYRHLDLNFFTQNWFNGTGPVWCYPNGDIRCINYTHARDINSIILKACCLAAEFPTLSMSIKIKSNEKEWNSHKPILIEIKSGKVTASVPKKSIYFDTSSDYVEMINQHHIEGKKIFSTEQLQIMQIRNSYESLLSTEQGKALIELENMVGDIGFDIQIRLDIYLQETMGISLMPSTLGNEQILTYIFDFDMDKLKEYLKDFRKAQEEHIKEREK